MKLKIIGMSFFLLTAMCLANETVLPVPQKMVVDDGAFKITPDTRIYTDTAAQSNGEFLAARLRKSTGYKIAVATGALSGNVPGDILVTAANAKATLGPEGYELSVSTNSIVIRAPEQAGCFYGVQTLLQLLPPEIFATQTVAGANWTVPCVQVEDQPRFKWRGMMLDVSRHFFNKEEIKEVLDLLALHKINTFHWHLVDDQGWRIEIKKYPRLTEGGAWRKDIGFGLDPKSSTAYGPDGRYGGFYTQDDIREVVEYAAARHITVVPEIEMPGHSGAALSAYPEFSCEGKPLGELGAGIHRGVYCAGCDETFLFIENILTEVMALFPSQYIHIGGDEVPKDNWKKCAACQARIKTEGLKDEHELQSYFVRRIEKFINAQGRTLIGWSEILQGGLAPNATVMDWIGGAEEATAAGHDVVMSPNTECYFNHCQSQERNLEPKAQGRFLPLRRAYAYEPVSAGLDPTLQHHVLGVQGNLWAEYIASLNHLEYMMFPRLSALAEVAWSPKEARNWDCFYRRLQTQLQRFDLLGVNYRRDPSVIIGEWSPAQVAATGSKLEYDITRRVVAAGNYSVSMDYTSGKDGIRIASVALLEDGREISRDVHNGIAAKDKTTDAVYKLELSEYKKNARYTIRIQATGDSAGSVTWRLQSTEEKAAAVVVGQWTPSQITTNRVALTWDVTKQFAAPGCQVSLNYARGKHGLKLISAALLEDGREVARDVHDGFTGTRSQNKVYTLKLPLRKADSKYAVRVQVEGHGGTDSFGNVTVSALPAEKK